MPVEQIRPPRRTIRHLVPPPGGHTKLDPLMSGARFAQAASPLDSDVHKEPSHERSTQNTSLGAEANAIRTKGIYLLLRESVC